MGQLVKLPANAVINPRGSLPPCITQILERRDIAWLHYGLPGRAVPVLPEAYLPVLEQGIMRYAGLLALAPTADAAKIALLRLSNHFVSTLPDIGEKQFGMLVQDYLADLAEFSPAVIEQACIRLRRSVKFWPKAAEIITECETIRAMWRWDLQRLEKLKAEAETQLRLARERAARVAQ